MIFYFSGTGNSRWVALETARLTGDEAVDIESVGDDVESRLQGQERLGLVFPVYAWGVPEPMATFARKLENARPRYAFGVCTYGGEAGRTMDELAKSIPLDAAFGIAMPNNYLIASDRESDEAIRAKIASARTEIKAIAADVIAERKANRVNVGSHLFLKSNVANAGFNRFARATKPFYATNACDGCGLCARRCPAKAISLDSGRPEWTVPTCFKCLRCFNECPRSAIQHGKSTEGRKRYTFRRFEDEQRAREGQ